MRECMVPVRVPYFGGEGEAIDRSMPALRKYVKAHHPDAESVEIRYRNPRPEIGALLHDAWIVVTSVKPITDTVLATLICNWIAKRREKIARDSKSPKLKKPKLSKAKDGGARRGTRMLRKISVRENEKPLLVMDGTGREQIETWFFDSVAEKFMCLPLTKQPPASWTAYRRAGKDWQSYEFGTPQDWGPVESAGTVKLLNEMDKALGEWVVAGGHKP